MTIQLNRENGHSSTYIEKENRLPGDCVVRSESGDRGMQSLRTEILIQYTPWWAAM